MGTSVDLGSVKGPKGDQGPIGPTGPAGPAGINATTTEVATSTSNGLMSASDKNILDMIFNEGSFAYYGYSSIYTKDTHEVYGFLFYDVEHNVPISMIIGKRIDTDSTLISDYIPQVSYYIFSTENHDIDYFGDGIKICTSTYNVGILSLNSNGDGSELSTTMSSIDPGVCYFKEYSAPM